ncbi:hypothetical protein FOZ60_005364 [Perkinsus olseni]|uniref:Uncharacterized protein n=1 Tax=Perkinsus olseni TaxID=32597 RepID=A0A7J6NR58_PEROL|nr:hypothetical protein FOZ60_005364 [Perkinsus olseni]
MVRDHSKLRMRDASDARAEHSSVARTSPMMKLIQPWLMVVQLLMCVMAQDVGRFEFSSNEFYMAFSVYEDHRVGITFRVDGKPAFADGLYHLLKRPGNTYEVDFRNTFKGVDYWYDNIDLLFPGKKFRKGDLAFLYYQTADSIAVNFRDRGILLTRVGFGINPGIYLYRSPDAPRLKVVYDIYADGGVRMQVWCDGGPSHYEIFKFNRADRPYVHYVVDPTEQAALDRYLDDVEKSCPALNLKKGRDLASVTFATGVTVVIPVEGARQLLEKL